MNKAFLLPLSALGALVGGAYLLTPLRERLTPRELAPDDCFVRVNGYELHVTDEGPRDGPPVLLLHGFAAWAFTWRTQRVELAQAGFRVITADQIGYGASERPAAAVYSTHTQAALMLGVLDSLGIGAAHLVGHSFGGRVAMQMALLAPQRVRSLALYDPEAFATERPPVARWLQVPLFGYTLAFYTTDPSLVRTGLKLVTRRHAWLTDEAVAGYAGPLRVRGSAAAQVWQAASPKDGPQPTVPDNLPALTARTLVLWGGDDPVFPAADGQKLAAILPDSQLRIFDGAGHLPHEEARAESTAALLEFLKAG